MDDIYRHFQTDSPGLSAMKRSLTKAKLSRRPTSILPTPSPHTMGDAERLDLDEILHQDTPFPDFDSMGLPPTRINAGPASPTRQPQAKVPAAQPQEGPFPPTPPATPRKVTPTVVFHELHHSVSNNDINRVAALLDHKHDPLGLPHDPYGSLPNAKKSSLALAAYLGREEIMLLFLQRGFAWAINQLIGADLPPLIAAAYAGHERVVNLLLSWRADARLRGPGDSTALFWASSRGHANIVRNLLTNTTARDDINSPNLKGLTPLMVASQHGHTETVRILLSSGADPALLNTKRQSALHLACHAGHSAAIGLLLLAQNSHTRFLNALTSNGKTPLIFAAISGHADACSILLSAGPIHVNTQDTSGKTALYHASSHGHGEAVEVLLAQGSASPEIPTHAGDSPLHIACERSHARAVGALLAHGAVLETPRASDGMSALQIAMWYKRTGILAPLILFQTQQDPERYTKEMALYSAAEWGLGETMDALLEAGADINAADALSRAVREGKEEAVRWLIEKGAEVDRVDRFGATPLHRAAKGGNLRVAELLLRAEADLEGRDRQGLTPLHVAAVWGTKEMVELLVRHGSQVEVFVGVQEGEQKTALGMAMENGRRDILEKLIELGASPSPDDMKAWKLQADRSFIVNEEGETEISFILYEMVA